MERGVQGAGISVVMSRFMKASIGVSDDECLACGW
jgi:hypothetical protein